MTFYSLDGPSLQGPLEAFLNAIRQRIPSDVSMNIEQGGDLIDAAKGTLLGTWVGSVQAQVDGLYIGNYAAPVGALCRWHTAEVRDGSKVRGRTFIVPYGGDNFSTAGDLQAAIRGELNAAAEGLVAAGSPNFVIWHRPYAGRAAIGTLKARPAHDGAAIIVTSADVASKAVILRSRRD